MAEPKLNVIEFFNYSDGEPPGDTLYECPVCDSTAFQVWDSLEAECCNCGTEVSFNAEDTDAT